MKIKIIFKTGTEQIVEVMPGKTAQLPAESGARYQFVDAQGNPLPRLKARRKGADLELTDEATGESVVLEGYYEHCAADACTLASADGSQTYAGEGAGLPASVDALLPGQEARFALGPAAPEAAPIMAGEESGGFPFPALGLLGLGLAAAGGGAAAAVAQVASYAISGGIAVGPVVTGHGLTVTAWDKAGNKLGESAVGADGKYSITISTGYKGAVLLKVTDASTGTDYFDEATGAAKDLTVDLRAAGSATGGNVTININPLTELAVRKLGITTDAATASEADITATNVKVGELFGLGAGKNISSETPVTVVKTDGTADTAANAYGKVLALISGMEKNKGAGTDAVLTDLADSLTGSGSILAFVAADANYIKTQLTAAAVTIEGAVTGVTVSDQIAAMDPVIAGATVAPLAWSNSAAAFSVAENGTAAFTGVALVTTSGATVTYTLGGTDAALFSVSATGVVTFASAPNYEAPADGGANNVYDLTITATDNATTPNTLTKTVAVTVTDVNEAPTSTAISAQTAVVNQAYSFNAATTFSDPDATAPNNTLTYSATGLPTGFTIDSAGTITAPAASITAAAAAVAVAVTATDGGGLSTSQTFNLGVVSAPVLSTNLGGVTNLDVKSKLVLTVGEDVNWTASGTYTFTLTNTANDATKAGYQTETTVHTQTISVVVDAGGVATSTGGSVTIDHTNHTIVIDPTYDLDLSNNYSLAVATGAFTGVTSGQASLAFTTVNFSTVTPGTVSGTSLTAAAQAQDMSITTGAMQNSLLWIDMTSVGAPTGAQLTLDASTGNYAFVGKGDVLDSTNTQLVGAGNVKFTNFGANDLAYLDDQINSGVIAQDSISNNAFAGGAGTSASPLNITIGGTDSVNGGSYVWDFVVDPAVTLPDVSTDQLLANVISNGWSNTGMVIAA